MWWENKDIFKYLSCQKKNQALMYRFIGTPGDFFLGYNRKVNQERWSQSRKEKVPIK